MSDSASSGPFSAPRGTYDVLPPESRRWEAAVRAALDTFARAGYEPIETPAFEQTEVFERGVGAASEVVTKQMYTFEDRSGRSLTLRPEGTAPVVRAAIEHFVARGALSGPVPLKLAYAGAMFRQERPQKGRYRQFFQVGIEALGSDSPLVDAEVIEIGARYLRSVGVDPRLQINSIGHNDSACRAGYIEVLADFLKVHTGELAEDDRDRVATSPLRTFDSKEEPTIAVMKNAPVISDYLCEGCKAHFSSVQSLLKDLDIGFELEPTLVRGLDYYTRTTFEYVAGGLGSQNAVGGGGRYDGLSEALGGPPLPGIGFALGIDRILLASTGPEVRPRIDVYFAAVGEDAAAAALRLATRLRAEGTGADLDFSRKGLKGQMKDAARSGARWAAIIGPDELATNEVTLRDLSTGEQRRIAWGDLVETTRR
ncbi:MAG: histidine--tRNA ligase [Actinomycetota bacterium]